jgi:Family of unknown function (DUF5772)
MSTFTRAIKRAWTIGCFIITLIFDTILVCFLKLSKLGILEENSEIINYYHKGQIYSIFVPIQRKPKTILSVLDENGNCVFDKVKKFIGPNEDFHGQTVTPKKMGYKGILEFITVNGNISFFKDDKIEL